MDSSNIVWSYFFLDQTHVFATGNCKTWNNETLEVTSPNFPGNYPPNTDCDWYFISQEEERIIEVHIDELALQTENNSNCQNDWIEMIDFTGGTLVKSEKFCDSIPGIPFRSTGRSVEVKFHSDGSLQDSGFKLSYRALGRYRL